MERRPDPPPKETDDVRLVALGTAGWLLGFVVLMVMEVAGRDVHDWWWQMCLVGAALGVLGVRASRRRRDRLQRSV